MHNAIPEVEQTGSVLVELRPFAHQAGGHTAVLELNASTICKPYEAREVWFYENEPESLKEFTPKYLGETDVSCTVCHDCLYLSAEVPRTLARQRGLTEFDPRSAKNTDPSVSGILNRKKGRKRCLSPEEPMPMNAAKSDLTSSLEVWSIKCIERQIDRYGFWANNQPQKFIMLENLVHTYRKPCLMDLKMGRRQFGDDSSAEKRQLLLERCAQSTSATLGFRICGTQLYQASTDQYCVHDKYVGRVLDPQGVVDEIRFFFSNGITFRKDAVKKIIEKLRRLKSTLLECDTLNFFSCSLLLIYEGYVEDQGAVDETRSTKAEDDSEQNGNNAGNNNTVHDDFIAETDVVEPLSFDVRLIDFAHVSEKCETKGDDNYMGKNSGVTNDNAGIARNTELDDTIIFGIEKLLEILEKLVA